MARNFNELIAKMSPESQQRTKEEANKMIKEIEAGFVEELAATIIRELSENGLETEPADEALLRDVLTRELIYWTKE